MDRSRSRTSFRQQVRDELAGAGGPLTISELMRRLLSDTPQETAEKRVRSALASNNRHVVRVGRGRYDLVERRLEGARFRYRVSPWECKSGLLYVADDLEFVFGAGEARGRSFADRDLTLRDGDGQTIEATPAEEWGPLPPHSRTAFGGQMRYWLIAGLGPFYRKNRLTAADDLIITVESVRPARYCLWAEKDWDRDEESIRAAGDDVVETCHFMLKYTKQAPADTLMHRLAGLYDFRRGPAPYLPMLLLPRDPRFIFFDMRYYLRDYLSPETMGLYEVGMEREEMQILLGGAPTTELTTEERAELVREIILEMIPESMATQEQVDRMVDRFLQERREALEEDARRTELLHRICLDRMRILRGLWPDEPDPGSPEEWLRRIGAPV